MTQYCDSSDPIAQALAQIRAQQTSDRERTAAVERARAALLERWRAYVAAAGPPDDDGDFTAWDSEGYRLGFADYCGDPWARLSAHEHERRLLAKAQTQFTDDERAHIASKRTYERWETPRSRHWVLLEDTKTPAPIAAHDAHAFAVAYRARLPEPMRDLGVVLGLRAGECVHVAVWFGTERTPHQIERWLRAFDEAERFNMLDEPRRALSGGEWTVLAPSTQVDDVRALAARPTLTASGVLRSGIPALDGQLRVGGIPDGSLVIVQGGPKACKTTTELQLVRAAREQGSEVVIIAGDESPVELHARLWQQRGLSPVEARKRAERGEHAYPNVVHVIDPREHPLQRILDAAANAAPVRMIVAESIQTLAPGGQHEIDALLVRLRATGKTVVAASEVVGGPRGRRAKGSTSIGYQASLTLDVERKGDAVRLRPMYSRLGTEDAIDLVLDADRQTLTAADRDNVYSVPRLTKAEARREEQIRAALAKGPKTAGALRQWVNGNGATLAAALERMVATGEVALNGDEYWTA